MGERKPADLQYHLFRCREAEIAGNPACSSVVQIRFLAPSFGVRLRGILPRFAAIPEPVSGTVIVPNSPRLPDFPLPSCSFLFVSQKLKHGGKYGFENALHPLGTEAVQGTKVRPLPAGEPHEEDVLPDGFSDLAGGIHTLSVGANDDFGKHFRVIAVTATTRVETSPLKWLVALPFYQK